MWFFIIPNQIGGKVQSLFPRFITIFIAVSSFFLIVRRKDISKEISHGTMNKKGIVRVIVIAIMFLIYILIIDFFGYFISSFLALVAFMLYFGVRDLKRLILIPFTLLLVIHFLIEKLLNFPLPKGMIF